MGSNCLFLWKPIELVIFQGWSGGSPSSNTRLLAAAAFCPRVVKVCALCCSHFVRGLLLFLVLCYRSLCPFMVSN